MKQALEKYRKELEAIREAGTWKGERIITTPQKSRIDTTQAKKVVNMCANNYLGLSNHPALIEAAKASYDQWGFGLSSVRFICGTQSIHKELEEKLAKFLGMDDVILYSSCFDANGGLFETLLGPEDAIISDELNHASIIDGVRLCKAKRYRYKNNDMNDLRAQLEDARSAGCQVKLIATDGVFSMDGYIADLKGICDLADEFDALVMVDDSQIHGQDRPGHAGVLRRAGPGGHHHRHLRQGPGRGLRRLHRRPAGDRGPAAPAQPSLSVLQHRGSRHLRRQHPDHRAAHRLHGAPGPGPREHRLLP